MRIAGLVGIIAIGLFVRLFGLHWDQGYLLHPDERFLSMVTYDVSLPHSLPEYFNEATSSLNPANKGHTFYVYGLFPVTLNKIIAPFFYNETLQELTIQGRVLSVCFDFVCLISLFFLILFFEKKMKFSSLVKYIAAFLYAVSVLPIQLSHFFTVDTFTAGLSWGSIILLLYGLKKGGHSILLFCSAWIFGTAIGSKVSALLFVPLFFFFFFFFLVVSEKKRNTKTILRTSLYLLIVSIGIYMGLRIASPYYFQTSSLVDFRLSPVFIKNLNILKSFDHAGLGYPPAVQWIKTGPSFAITNIILYGIGLPYAIFSVVGMMLLIIQLKKKTEIVAIIVWCVCFVVYYSFQFSKTMRYLYPIYPVLALSAAYSVQQLVLFISKKSKKLINPLFSLLFILGVISLWTIAFMSIYTKDHSRIEASKWIIHNIKPGSKLLTEYWDDPLPLPVLRESTPVFALQEVHIFDPDTKEKWEKLRGQLAMSDYYITSSNRAWGSISKNPELYPLSYQFHHSLANGKLGYELIKEFHSYPSLRYLGIPIEFSDTQAEEAFTVYDHPQIHIYQKKK